VAKNKNTLQQKRKQQPRDPSQGRPLTIEALAEYDVIEDITPPEGPFDPQGRWEHTYQIWSVGVPRNQYGGFLMIKRRPSAKGKSLVLSIQKTVLQSSLTIHRTRATIQCSNDILATPRFWMMDSVLLDRQGKPIELAKVSDVTQVKDGMLINKTGLRTEEFPIGNNYTSDFSLIDAVQRLGLAGASPMPFTLLEGLERIKPNHRLMSGDKTAEVKIGGRQIKLHCYRQIGEGILPQEYWLDDRQRLIVMLGTIMAYIWDPKASERLQTEIDKELKREEQRNKWIEKKMRERSALTRQAE